MDAAAAVAHGETQAADLDQGIEKGLGRPRDVVVVVPAGIITAGA